MTKIRLLKFTILIIVMSIVIYYINERIWAYDMRFYSGKDNGAIVVIESTAILSSLFYLFMSKRYKFIQFVGGGLLGVISSIVSYLIVALFRLDKILNDLILTFHILGCIIFIIIFFLIERSIEFHPTNNTGLLK